MIDEHYLFLHIVLLEKGMQSVFKCTSFFEFFTAFYNDFINLFIFSLFLLLCLLPG